MSWSLRSLAEQVDERSQLDCSADRRLEIDDNIRTAMALLRRMLPAGHPYVTWAYQVVNSGARALVVIDEIAASHPDAALPLQDVMSAAKEAISVENEVHHEDGVPLQTRVATSAEVVDMALHDPVKWMRTFLSVKSVETGPEGRVIKRFDLDGSDARSRYQRLAYGGFLKRWAADDPHVPVCVLNIRKGRQHKKSKRKTRVHKVARTKPRQVGSTTFWKKFAVLAAVSISDYKALLHFPGEGDAKKHLQSVHEDLVEITTKWPHYFPAITRKSLTDGVIELANGSTFETRHGDIKAGGISKLGSEYNLVILSEAGKYERKGGRKVWEMINQVIMPAVHPGTRNVIVWEGTNDETAHELNRIALLDDVDFQFFGWGHLPAYEGRSIDPADQEETPAGRYADFEVNENGDVIDISERAYVQKYRLTRKQVGFRREKIDELEDISLVHKEYPWTYAESLGLTAGGFFSRMQKMRAPDRIIDIMWEDGLAADQESVYANTVVRETSSGQFWEWSACACKKPIYAVAGDFADGVPSGDFTSIPVACAVCGLQRLSARFRGTPKQQADCLARVVSYLEPKRTWVCGEYNNVGKAVFSEWLNYGHNRNYFVPRDGDTSHGFDTNRYWFRQTSASREPALISFRGAYNREDLRILDPRFEWDAEGFVRNERGKYCAIEGKSIRTGEKYRDDQVMSAAILWTLIKWMRERGLAKGLSYEDKAVAADRTMLGSMSTRMQRILRKHSA